MEIAFDLEFIRKQEYESLVQECYQVLGLLNRLIDSLRETKRPPRGVSTELTNRKTLKARNAKP